MAAALSIYPGDEVFVDDAPGIVGHVRRANLREVFVFVEAVGDFTLPRESVNSAANGRVTLICRKLPLPMRAAIGHLHGEKEPDAD